MATFFTFLLDNWFILSPSFHTSPSQVFSSLLFCFGNHCPSFRHKRFIFLFCLSITYSALIHSTTSFFLFFLCHFQFRTKCCSEAFSNGYAALEYNNVHYVIEKLVLVSIFLSVFACILSIPTSCQVIS